MPYPEEGRKNFLLHASEHLTLWIGSPASIVLHTLFFIGMFGLALFGVAFDRILLVLTTAVSLEAIYLAIFIQMTVNRHTRSLEEVEEEIEELGEEVEELGEEVEDIGEDIEEISDDIDKIQEEESVDEKRKRENSLTLDNIQNSLQKLMGDIEALKRGGGPD